MAASTGPVLAAGAIVVGNAVLLGGRSMQSQTRTVVATLIAAGGLSLLEAAMPRVAVGLAWLTLTAVLLVPVDAVTPAPLENLARWYREV